MSKVLQLRSRALRVIACLAMASGLLVSVADASTVNRAFTPRYAFTGRVDSYLIGNTVLNCSGTGCATAQNGTGNNNDFSMGFVDVDSDASTFNSSRAPLVLPAGATIRAAFLYWGADTSTGGGGAAPNAGERGTVRLTGPGGSTSSVVATRIDAGSATRYTAVADVTGLVQAAGEGDYTVANVQAGRGTDRYGGWSMVVVIDNPAADAPLRSVTLFDGSATIDTNSPSDLGVTVSGFRTPASGEVGARIGLVAFEGDNGYTGDQFLVNGRNLTDALNPSTNPFNASNTRLGAHQTGRLPQQTNLLGLDIDYIQVPEYISGNSGPKVIPNNATSANLTFRTTQDVYFPVALLFQTNVYEPEIVTNFSKSSTDLNGGVYRPGDVVEYTISLSNTGDDSSDVTVITDPLPSGVTYVPGSLQVVSGPNAGAKTDASGDDQAEYIAASRTVRFRVGTGANAATGGRIAPVPQADSATVVRFRATIDDVVGDGTDLENVANVGFIGATSRVPSSGSTPPSTFTVTRDADLSITKTGPATVALGGTVSYVVTVSNAGAMSADGALVTDNVPAALSGVAITCAPSGGASCPATAGLATLAGVAIPTLPSGGSVAFTITGTAPSTATALSNSASVAPPAGTSDPQPGNNTAGPVETTVQSTADLSVAKTLVTAGPYFPGQNVSYSIVVDNAGPDAAVGVSLTDALPGDLTFVSLTAPASWSATTPAVGTNGTITVTRPSLASGESATFTVVVAIPNGSANGTAYANVATVAASSTDPTGGDNSSTSTFTVSAGADLSMSKTLVTAGPYLQGQSVQYTLVVRNDGPVAATGVQVTDTPTNLAITAVTGACTALPCTIASIASGSTATINVTATIVEAGAFDNAATATGTQPDPNPGDNTDTTGNGGSADPSADLSVTKTAAPGPYYPGRNLTYTITVANAGPGAAVGATLTDALPAGTTFVSLSAPGGWTATTPAVGATGTVSATTPSLASGASAVFTLVVRVDDSATGSITNTATADSSTTDPEAGDNASTSTVTITPQADVGVQKVLLTGSPARAGSTVTWRIVVQNRGPSAVNGVTLVDDVPSQLSDVTWTCSGTAATCSAASGMGDLDLLLDLEADGLVTVTVSGTAPATTPSTIGANTAVIQLPAGTDDPQLGDNESTVPPVTVSALPIEAVDNTGSLGGAAGGTAVSNVLANDTLDAVTATLASVTLTVVTPATNAGVVLDTTTGAVTVAAGTPAGTYAVTYRICERANPTNCDTATATVTVTAATLAATDDAGSIGGASGGTAVPNVLVNDTVNGTTPTLATVALRQVSTSNPSVTIDPATGAVNIAPGTPAGVYTLVYEICERLNPDNCTTATVTVTVTAATLVATNDSGSIGGAAGGTAVPNVLGNDTVNGTTATLATVALRQVSTSNPSVTIDPATGAVSVAPGTPAGAYTLVYEICERLNPTNCTTATVTVTVTAATLAATDDSGSVGGAAGGTAVPDVLVNDTVNGTPAALGTVALRQVATANPGITLDPATGAVNVAAGTPEGLYTLVYEICERLNPANCTTATVRVTVTAAALVANPDVGTVGGREGGVAVPDVLVNDRVGGTVATLANVTLAQVSTSNPAVTLDPATGAVNVAPGTPAGTYTLEYRICERLNPANCTSTTATVTVTAAPIEAIDDAAGPVSGLDGASGVVNVLGNDRLDGAAVVPADVVLAPVVAGPLSLDASGRVDVAPGTPAGTYTLTYRICERLNPANCDEATVTVTVVAPAIVANDDTGASVAGAAGGVAIASVLGNDTLGGAAATTGNVAISLLAPASNPGVVLDTATGAVTVAAGTAAGTYTLTYRICDRLNPTSCDDAVATVAVAAAELEANDDTGRAAGATGGTAVANVLGNDRIDGDGATLATVSLEQVSTSNPAVTLDPATGAVNVAPGTPAGIYTLTYRICERLNPANCDIATVTVTVEAAVIDAVDDAAPAVTGASGGTGIANVLGNDTLDSAPATTTTVTLEQVSTSNPNLALDPSTGTVTVAPGTPAGTYTLTYRICERLNPANCDIATVTVTVEAAVIDAVDDAAPAVTGASGGTGIANVLGNDTLDGAPATTSTVTIEQVSTSNPAVTLDPATGAVNVAPGMPAGSYTLTYRICERLNPANCDTAVVTVTVTAAPIDAVDDVPAPVTGSTGGTVTNVLGNDTLDGAPATTTTVTLEQVSTSNPNVTLDPATGTVTVAPGTPAGTYTLTYRICERLNPANCDIATVTVTVEAAVIDAVDDSTPPVESGRGGNNVANVLGNDTLDGAPATTSTVTLEQVSTSNPNVTLDPATGAVNVAPGTPAGTYTLTYRICEQLNPANCDTATVSVNVVAPTLEAGDDAGTTPQGTPVTVPVLGNDTLDGGPIDPTRAIVTITGGPSQGTVTVNADGTVTYTPTGTYSGPDTFAYQVCDRINPTVCTTATVDVTVTPNTVDAIDQTIDTPQTGPVVIDPMTTTRTGGGAPLDPTSVQIVTPPSSGTVVVNPNGTITYTPNTTFFGTETFSYRICDTSTPTPVCDVATVTIEVAMQAPQLRITKTTPSRTVNVGDLVRYTVVVENTGISPANGATVVDVPPTGFTYVEGSLSVDDADDRFALASADPLRITGIDVPVGGRATLVYLLRVGAGVGRGTHTNTVSATDAIGTSVSNTATADVVVEGDPMTEDSLILGTVFFDRDGNGVQDEGEPGLAGVRIASVEGLLIETDQHGRYHLAGISAENALRGRNFILKVDVATLPPGTTFTTPNPLVRRITPGIPVRFDFGVRPPSQDAPAGN